MRAVNTPAIPRDHQTVPPRGRMPARRAHATQPGTITVLLNLINPEDRPGRAPPRGKARRQDHHARDPGRQTAEADSPARAHRQDREDPGNDGRPAGHGELPPHQAFLSSSAGRHAPQGGQDQPPGFCPPIRAADARHVKRHRDPPLWRKRGRGRPDRKWSRAPGLSPGSRTCHSARPDDGAAPSPRPGTCHRAAHTRHRPAAHSGYRRRAPSPDADGHRRSPPDATSASRLPPEHECP